jgi:hypothetical protein
MKTLWLWEESKLSAEGILENGSEKREGESRKIEILSNIKLSSKSETVVS